MSDIVNFFINVDEFDQNVMEYCNKHSSSRFDMEKVYNILTDRIPATPEEVYCAYYWYCWKMLYISFLKRGGLSFETLPVTRNYLISNNIVFSKDYLFKNHNRCLFYITCGFLEYLNKSQDLYAISADDRTWPLISKVEGLLGRIDDITLELKFTQHHLFSLLPYTLASKKMESNTNDIEKMVLDSEEKFKRIVNDPRWEEILTFLNENKNLDHKLKSQSDLIEQIDKYEKNLLNKRSEYNFVTLADAFVSIRKIKKNEMKKANFMFYGAAVLLLLTPLLLLLFHISEHASVFEGWMKLFYILPVTTFELLLLYFTRLFYFSKNAVMAQLLQIDFRLTICEFIESYVEDRKTSTENQETWRSFEALIFSPIQMKEDKIPSVLDGADAIAEFINKALKAKATN